MGDSPEFLYQRRNFPLFFKKNAYSLQPVKVLGKLTFFNAAQQYDERQLTNGKKNLGPQIR